MDAPATPAAAAPLPDDPRLLQQMIRELLAALRERDRELDGVRARLDQLLRRLYGPRAERFDPNQPWLFPELAAPPSADTQVSLPPPPETTPAARPTPHGRRRLPAHLRREVRRYELTEAERACPGCGQCRAEIGCESSEQLDWVPASLFIVEHQRVRYACRCCQEHVALAPKPAQALAKGLPGPGLLAQVVVSKYADHLPLHRQERILERHGVSLDRSTLCQWTAAVAEALTPVYTLMIALVRQSPVIHSDDTPLPVLDGERERATRQGHLWVYYGDRTQPYTVFDYTPNHSQSGPEQFLQGFHGYLQVDGYAGYASLCRDEGPWTVACWAHARRYFYDARTSDAARAAEALARIRQLYEVEHAADQELARLPRRADPLAQWQQEDAVRLRLRQERSVPLLSAFREWLEREQPQVLPKSPLGQALTYAVNQWPALQRYTTAGCLAIDNNVSERTLRQCVLGRKNYLFAGSDRGGQTAAILYSFTATCRRHDLDPFAYLRDVLTRLPTQPPERLVELLPDRWAAARPPNTS